MNPRRVAARVLLAGTFLLAAAMPALAAPSADSLSIAQQRANLALEDLTVWNGPTTGPEAATGKTIAFVASDLKNGGVKGALNGVEEAAEAIGWKLQVFDTASNDEDRKKALLDIAAAHFDGVIFAGFDATPYAPWIDNVAAAGMTVIGWHAAYEPGIVPGTQLFTNVASSAREVALAAASYAVVKSGGAGGFVIFTDSRFSVAQAKTDDMATIVKNCPGCQLLSIEDVRLDRTAEDMPARLENLDRQFGDRWTVNLGINDLYFDAMAALPDARADLVNISAGDGSTSAFLRVGTGLGQTATVAEPLNLQGWQLIDELNRAFHNERPSGYVPRPRLFTSGNLAGAVGEDFFFDPPNGYRQAYRRIWGK
ncbi:MAG TPA: substrate-binding domain-containing protein [Hypericibacter adhaerens]|jgi:ribose transport system substrate-binding protein|uniref:substrate-binding domain-containing protein n=1 Tax=Hypericibacter adhaerens TaxID=2602016 RepID=UPI002BA7926C|nr:substrate-binding domain-containing protein [Hypericibacter adhaerens]HWA46180.1 substrate-binding domain-containing protein [Hypericibacter adhaerens]